MADDSVPSTTKTCTKCGESRLLDAFRFVSNHGAPRTRHSQCRACERASRNACHAANREHERAYMRLWRAAHKAKLAEDNKTWCVAHPDLRRASDERYRLKNPSKKAQRDSQRRARKRNLPHTLTYEQTQFCRQYFHCACAYCGKEEGFLWCLALDHFIPLASPECPGTVATNIVVACHGIDGCNTSKKDRDPRLWLRERFGSRKAATILRKIKAYFATVRARATD